MARLHVQTRAAGQCDSHCRVIDSHDLHHTDDTNHAGYQQLTIKNMLQSGEIKTIDSISFVGLSEPMSVDAAITAIKNNALAEIKTSGEKGEIHNLPMKRFVGHTEVEEDGLEICLYFSNMSEKTREKFVEAFND